MIINPQFTRRLGVAAAASVAFFHAPAASAQASVADNPCGDETSCERDGRVIYLPGFFADFNPVTARDMVARVPGFSIDRGEDVRGFGAAAGNVLIDGQRPSTKSSDIDDILNRISAANIARIELIRGGSGDLDVAGQSVVVNVVRLTGGDASSAPWSFSLVQRVPRGGLRPRGEINYSGALGAGEISLGGFVTGISIRFDADETIERFSGLDEVRMRDGAFRDQGGGVNASYVQTLGDGDVFRLNAEAEILRMRDVFQENRFIENGIADIAFFDFPEEEISFEIGGDYERSLSANLGVKFIALYGREFEESESRFALQPEVETPLQSVFESEIETGETIGRVEFDYRGVRGHALQFGGEFARNTLESEASLQRAEGGSPLAPVEIAGANTRVAELRGEMFATDSWTASPRLTIDLGIAVELSRIAQSGDVDNSRFFVYPKPSLALAYSPNANLQLRASARRNVGQLDFGQFVSSVNFDDEDVDFGNPELQPQREWAFEGVVERRFGEIGVFQATAFYTKVQDVEDLLPIGEGAEVPGNIGDGTIIGGRIDATIPLDWLGLKNARIDGEYIQQSSSVVDPVTGEDRSFSFLADQEFEIEFQQDFPAARVTWGWEVDRRSPEFGFGLDETFRDSAEPEFQVFVERTFRSGIKMRLDWFDISNTRVRRDRTLFEGSRALNQRLLQEMRETRNGGAIRLRVSGVL